MTRNFVSSDDIRSRFSRAMSAMYRSEVPQYGTLVELVEEINDLRLRDDPDLAASLERSGELSRLSEERHGAIRLGTPGELATIARVFAVMGMHPVGYYDLSVAGIPVHSTAFRPIDPAALSKNPFRVFTSLLRLDWIEDESLRREAEDILSRLHRGRPRPSGQGREGWRPWRDGCRALRRGSARNLPLARGGDRRSGNL